MQGIEQEQDQGQWQGQNQDRDYNRARTRTGNLFWFFFWFFSLTTLRQISISDPSHNKILVAVSYKHDIDNSSVEVKGH